jgi:hypothetical protein
VQGISLWLKRVPLVPREPNAPSVPDTERETVDQL